jgi:hypothetical protein
MQPRHDPVQQWLQQPSDCMQCSGLIMSLANHQTAFGSSGQRGSLSSPGLIDLARVCLSSTTFLSLAKATTFGSGLLCSAVQCTFELKLPNIGGAAVKIWAFSCACGPEELEQELDAHQLDCWCVVIQ